MAIKKHNLILGAGAAVLTILGGIWFLNPSLFSGNGGDAGENQSGDLTAQLGQEYKPGYSATVEAGIFSHPGFGFSFVLPDGFKVLENEYGEEAKIITVEKNEKEGFQIFISPFDEPGPLSPERILIDEPDLVIKNPQQATLDGVPALVFEGESEIGPTFEIWLINKGNLYQITTYLDFASGFQEILQTWKFLQ